MAQSLQGAMMQSLQAAMAQSLQAAMTPPFTKWWQEAANGGQWRAAGVLLEAAA